MSIDSAFTDFPTIVTPRLRLRSVTLADTDALLAMRSDPEVTHPYGHEPYRSRDESRTWIENRIAGYKTREALYWFFSPLDEDSIVGSCCLWHFDFDSQAAEIGYELPRSQWGKGIATEGVSAILRFAFTDLELNRIEACPLADNEPSKKLLLKLGFTLEGNLRQRVRFHDRYVDQLYYGLLRKDWLDRNRPDAERERPE
jgi:ribosomal-protein-alanine N-acetyltransferase